RSPKTEVACFNAPRRCTSASAAFAFSRKVSLVREVICLPTTPPNASRAPSILCATIVRQSASNSSHHRKPPPEHLHAQSLRSSDQGSRLKSPGTSPKKFHQSHNTHRRVRARQPLLRARFESAFW